MTRPVTLIAAVARNGAIGIRNGLPWRLPSDMKRFKALTMGKPLIMGRKTYRSLGRPLPGRHLVVVTRDPSFAPPDGIVRAASMGEAFARAEALAALHGAEEVMVGGGAEIYRAAMDRADALRITEVDLAPEADSLFPAIDPAAWREVSRVPQPPGPSDESAFSYVDYHRR